MKTPTLILVGEKDLRVPCSQGKVFYKLLKAQGTETRWVQKWATVSYKVKPCLKSYRMKSLHWLSCLWHKTFVVKRETKWFIVWIAYCSRCHISRLKNTRLFSQNHLREKKTVFLASLPSLALCFQPRSRLFVGLEYAKIRTVLQSTIFLPRGLVGSCNCKFIFFYLFWQGVSARKSAFWRLFWRICICIVGLKRVKLICQISC